MKIGFDLDNILIDTPPLIPHWLIERLYRGHSGSLLLYRIPSRREQLIRQIAHLPVFRSVIKQNINFIRNISKEQHKIYLVSSRFSFLKNHTDRLVKKHNLKELFHALYFNFDNEQPHIFKNKYIKILDLDKYVDDDLQLLKYIAAHNNHVKLYWFNNKINEQISRNIQAITQLPDILKD